VAVTTRSSPFPRAGQYKAWHPPPCALLVCFLRSPHCPLRSAPRLQEFDMQFVRYTAMKGHGAEMEEACARRQFTFMAFFTSPCMVPHVFLCGILSNLEMSSSDAWQMQQAKLHQCLKAIEGNSQADSEEQANLLPVWPSCLGSRGWPSSAPARPSWAATCSASRAPRAARRRAARR
jgi:hypothetical protein